MAVRVDELLLQIKQLPVAQRLQLLAEVSADLADLADPSRTEAVLGSDSRNREPVTRASLLASSSKIVETLDELRSGAWPEDEDPQAFELWLAQERDASKQ
ncbi:MAG: hypothetical protein AAGI01_18060 [Myxococcota bacterium]